MLRNWKNKKKGPSWIFKQHFQSSDPCFRFSYFAIWTKMTWKILVDKKWYFMHYWFVKEHQNSKSERGIDWSSRSREVGGVGDKKKRGIRKRRKRSRRRAFRLICIKSTRWYLAFPNALENLFNFFFSNSSFVQRGT